MSNEEIIAAINQFDIREVRDINGLWNTLQECRAALESRAISDTHRVVSIETVKDAERYTWIKNHAGEQLTQRSLMNEFSEHKTEYVFPRLIAWADFCGPITLDEAIDFKIAALAEQQAIIDNKG